MNNNPYPIDDDYYDDECDDLIDPDTDELTDEGIERLAREDSLGRFI